MRNKFVKITACFMLAMALVLSSAITAPKSVEAAIALRTASVTLYTGDKYQLQSYGTTKAITFKSSDEKVAKVSKAGVVTAVAKGTATITATSDSKSYTCKVTVKNLALSKSKVTLELGQEEELTLNASKPVSTKSSDSKVAAARIDSLGQVIIHPNGAGTCTITVTAENGKSAKCTVKVSDKDPYVLTKTTTTYKYGDDTEPYDTYNKSYTYDSKGNVITLTDNDTKYKYTYYDNGNLRTQKISYSDGSTISRDYDERGNLLKEISESCEFTSEYDSKNRQTKSTYYYPNTGSSTAYTYEYDDFGNNYRSTRVETENGKETDSYSYVNIGLRYSDSSYIELVDEENPDLSRGAYYIYYFSGDIKYDKQNRPIEVNSDYENAKITYDKKGLLSCVTYYNQSGTEMSSSTYSYNSNKQLTGVVTKWDKSTEKSTYSYNKYGKIEKYADDYVTITYTYDKYGNMATCHTKSVYGYESTYTYTYDKNGLLKKLDYKTDNTWDCYTSEYTYNGSELVSTTVTSQDGTYTYSNASNDDYNDGFETEYTYDDNGNVIKKVNEYSTTEYTYDSKNRLIKKVSNSYGDEFITTYTYDKASGKLASSISLEYGEEYKVTYEYGKLSKAVKK